MGPDDEYVVSGSDCGHVFIWEKRTKKLITMLKGDEDVVNCLEPHPVDHITLCTSGIDHSIKVGLTLIELFVASASIRFQHKISLSPMR